MKDYLVESFIYYSKATLDKKHILKDSTKDIQLTCDEYARKGYRLAQTESFSFGNGVYVYLFFERDI